MKISRHREILNFIELIRESFPQSVKVYTEGSCFQFYRILKKVFPDAECYCNIDHVVTKIGNYFYDINGIVHEHESYRPYSTFERKKIKSQSKKVYSK